MRIQTMWKRKSAFPLCHRVIQPFLERVRAVAFQRRKPRPRRRQPWRHTASKSRLCMPLSPIAASLGSPYLTSTAPQPNLVLILLNYTLPNSTATFWRRAQLRICADGGANRLYDAAPGWHPLQTPETARAAYLPDVIKGDLDSIRPEVAEFYSKRGTRIVDLSEDQDTTDLHKCLHCVEQRLAKENVPLSDATVLAIGALGGRLDHTLSNVNTLYSHQRFNLVLCGDGSLARLIPAGRSVIKPEQQLEGPMCGLLALGSPALASSTGLKWNLDHHRLEVGGLMSTSNMIEAAEVVVESTEPLLWSTEFRDDAPSS